MDGSIRSFARSEAAHLDPFAVQVEAGYHDPFGKILLLLRKMEMRIDRPSWVRGKGEAGEGYYLAEQAEEPLAVLGLVGGDEAAEDRERGGARGEGQMERRAGLWCWW